MVVGAAVAVVVGDAVVVVADPVLGPQETSMTIGKTDTSKRDLPRRNIPNGSVLFDRFQPLTKPKVLEMSDGLAQSQPLVTRAEVGTKHFLHDMPGGGSAGVDYVQHSDQASLVVKEDLFGSG